MAFHRFLFEHPFVKVNSKCPVFTLSQVLGARLPKSTLGAQRFFSPDLLVSNNYYHQHLSGMKDLSVEVPFTQEQKPLFHVLVIQDGEELKMMLIDQNDSAYFHRKLRDHLIKGKAEERKVGIYDLRNGLIIEGKNRFTDLEKNRKFQELLVQAKLMNGEVHFSPEELKVIRDRVQETKAEGMGAFVDEYLLAHHPENKSFYFLSPLGKMLKLI